MLMCPQGPTAVARKAAAALDAVSLGRSPGSLPFSQLGTIRKLGPRPWSSAVATNSKLKDNNSPFQGPYKSLRSFIGALFVAF